MDLRRVSVWEWLTGLAGLVLLVSLWLPWYGVVGLTANAWVAFTYVDLILALAALGAILLPIVTATQSAAAFPRLWARWLFWLALVAAIFAVIRLINVPGVDTLLAGGAADITRKAGGFIGAAAAIAIVVFDWRAKRDTSFPGPLREHPTIDTLPPPTAEQAPRREVR
jgi:hypothetical protein